MSSPTTSPARPAERVANLSRGGTARILLAPTHTVRYSRWSVSIQTAERCPRSGFHRQIPDYPSRDFSDYNLAREYANAAWSAL